MNSLCGALFDFDGTIFLYEKLHQECVNEIFYQHFGQGLAPDELKAYAGLTYLDRFTHILHSRNIDDENKAHKMAQQALALFDERMRPKELITPGLTRLLKRLHRQHIPVAVVSSALHARIERDLRQVGLREYFPKIIGRDDVRTIKPHPEPYLTALQQLTISADAAVAFEDSPVGIEAARLAGIRVIALTTTFDADDLAKAQKVISDFKGLTIKKIEEVLKIEPA